MKVAVIGANGQLGTDLVQEFQRNGAQVVGLTHADLDVASLESTRGALRGITTDYVFDGLKRSPYIENDDAAPLNVYGNTKLAGEAFLRGLGERYFIVRTSALYGKSPCRGKAGRNFVDLMLKLAREREELRVVNDEVVSPTPTAELARQIVILCQTEEYGLYHATSEGSCSWYEYAKAIFELTNTRVNLKIADPGEFPAKVSRPKYSVLENANLKKLGLNVFLNWQEGLRSYLEIDSSRAFLASMR